MECAVLFSGGSDSTLAAAMAAEQFTLVHLLTMNREGYYRAELETEENFQRLIRVYGKDRFQRKIIDVNYLHEELKRNPPLTKNTKFGLTKVALSFAKISLHGAAARYCLQNHVSLVFDGAVPYMYLYPDQNPRIGGRLYKKFYQSLGLRYESPVAALSLRVEELLFDRAITPSPTMRGTTRDRQVFYAEQIIFALWLKSSIACFGYRAHRRRLEAMYTDRLTWLKTRILAENTPHAVASIS